MLWTCNNCGVIILPEDLTTEALVKAMKDHLKTCPKAVA